MSVTVERTSLAFSNGVSLSTLKVLQGYPSLDVAGGCWQLCSISSVHILMQSVDALPLAADHSLLSPSSKAARRTPLSASGPSGVSFLSLRRPPVPERVRPEARFLSGSGGFVSEPDRLSPLGRRHSPLASSRALVDQAMTKKEAVERRFQAAQHVNASFATDAHSLAPPSPPPTLASRAARSRSTPTPTTLPTPTLPPRSYSTGFIWRELALFNAAAAGLRRAPRGRARATSL